MFRTLEETAGLIQSDKLLIISGNETLLRQLPKGKWIGGVTEYLSPENGITGGRLLYVSELNFDAYRLAEYSAPSIEKITRDAYDNGFTVLIIPFESGVHAAYARFAASRADLGARNITGWVSGINLGNADSNAYTIDGYTGGFFTDKAVAAHVKLEADQAAMLNIVNIFSPDANSPVITVDGDGFIIRSCRVDGRETDLAEYINTNSIDVRLPLIGDYSGAGVNVSIREIRDGEVLLYAPVFEGIEYRFAEKLPDYAQDLMQGLDGAASENPIFSCNSILNYFYGEMENKGCGGPPGPVVFGEIAGRLLNQTLVYLQITENEKTPASELVTADTV